MQFSIHNLIGFANLLRIKLTCNWFVLGWRCWRNGHAWDNQFVTIAPDFKWEGESGVLSRKETGKSRIYHARTCTRCGKFMGIGWKFR